MTLAAFLRIPIYTWVGDWMSSHPFVNTYSTHVFYDMEELYKKVEEDLGNTNGCYELLFQLLSDKYDMELGTVMDLVKFLEADLGIKIC
jgi:hypothetical protein